MQRQTGGWWQEYDECRRGREAVRKRAETFALQRSHKSRTHNREVRRLKKQLGKTEEERDRLNAQQDQRSIINYQQTGQSSPAAPTTTSKQKRVIANGDGINTFTYIPDREVGCSKKRSWKAKEMALNLMATCRSKSTADVYDSSMEHARYIPHHTSFR